MGRQTGRLKTGVPTKNKALLPEPLRTGENQGIIMERHRRLCLLSVTERKKISMERAEIISQILEDVAEVSPEDVNENSVLMDDLDLSSMEILTIVADLEETFGLRIPEKELRNFVTIGDLVDYLAANAG
jgi:acyl carrier protein